MSGEVFGRIRRVFVAGPVRGDASRHLSAIIHSRIAGKTLDEIGKGLGVTRERIRQIIAASHIDDSLRSKITGSVKVKKVKKVKPKSLRIAVLRWIRESGSAYCSQGKHVVAIEDLSGGRMCRECNAAKGNKYYHDNAEARRRYARDYRRKNPEVQRRASQKWLSKQDPERIRERNRRKWQAIKADPQRLAEFNHKARLQYKRRRARGQQGV